MPCDSWQSSRGITAYYSNNVPMQFRLEGKMTATHSSEELIALTNEWLSKMPSYPHAEIKPFSKKSNSTRKPCL